MEQKSNVQYRAEKEYKNSREKFFLLLREIISNSIHAVLIRQNKETNFIPQLDLNITFDENQCKIELRDNGEGFTEKNRLYFEELDKKNLEKEQFNQNNKSFSGRQNANTSSDLFGVLGNLSSPRKLGESSCS